MSRDRFADGLIARSHARGAAAVVLCRGISRGTYRGERFHLVERVSSEFVRREGEWRCVLTDLSRLEEES